MKHIFELHDKSSEIFANLDLELFLPQTGKPSSFLHKYGQNDRFHSNYTVLETHYTAPLIPILSAFLFLGKETSENTDCSFYTSEVIVISIFFK